jgi:hypothetical protein
MSQYQSGASTDGTGLTEIAQNSIGAGSGDYIFVFQGPLFIYNVISPETLAKVVKTWLYAKNYASDGTTVVDVTGVTVDTDSGVVSIRASVSTSGVTQDAINPLVVIAVLAALLGAIGAYTLLRVLDAGAGTTPNAIDPCTQSGIIAYLQCTFGRAKWFVLGAAVGILALVIYLFLKEAEL